MKKFLGVLLSLIMMLSLVPVMVSAESEYIEVGTVEDFKNILASNGDKSIIVTRDIIYTCQVNDVGSYWITLGSGEKTLNLNGKSVELNAETVAQIRESAQAALDSEVNAEVTDVETTDAPEGGNE